MDNNNPVRRLRPPDRRAPIKVAARSCTLGRGCLCCPAYTSKYRGQGNDKCQLDHPAEPRVCIPPVPERISPCKERDYWSQDPLPAVTGWTPPHHECCVECGRVTARRWTRPEDGVLLAWCAGQQVEPPETVVAFGRSGYLPQPEAEPLSGPPKKRRARYNPALRRHSWTKTSEHWRSCDWCRIRVGNQPDPHSPRWFQEWDYPDRPGLPGGNNQHGGTVPNCLGPEQE